MGRPARARTWASDCSAVVPPPGVVSSRPGQKPVAREKLRRCPHVVDHVGEDLAALLLQERHERARRVNEGAHAFRRIDLHGENAAVPNVIGHARRRAHARHDLLARAAPDRVIGEQYTRAVGQRRRAEPVTRVPGIFGGLRGVRRGEIHGPRATPARVVRVFDLPRAQEPVAGADLFGFDPARPVELGESSQDRTGGVVFERLPSRTVLRLQELVDRVVQVAGGAPAGVVDPGHATDGVVSPAPVGQDLSHAAVRAWRGCPLLDQTVDLVVSAADAQPRPALSRDLSTHHVALEIEAVSVVLDSQHRVALV
jgi:hypothetical protein